MARLLVRRDTPAARPCESGFGPRACSGSGGVGTAGRATLRVGLGSPRGTRPTPPRFGLRNIQGAADKCIYLPPLRGTMDGECSLSRGCRPWLLAAAPRGYKPDSSDGTLRLHRRLTPL